MNTLVLRFLTVLTLTSLTIRGAEAAVEPSQQFLDYVRRRAADLRAGDRPPANLAEWRERKAQLRKRFSQALGPLPEPGSVDAATPLNPRKLGEIRRHGYRVEKLLFQTMPGIWMPANAYVPDGPGPFPAVLCVHGHWRGAKQDPVVQSRCIGLARLGFLALVVDAFGAGERGIGKALGEYHGEMVAATLIPTGRVLAGIQIQENVRAVDYLQSRPDVDPERIGVTGASGGGNQTMYVGAWDERLKAVVPTCSVGNYQAYLGAACCMCEVVPGALTFTEEWGLLAMTAPRALMVVSATKDAPQFSVTEATKSIAVARPVFGLHRASDKIRHTIIESPHHYNQPMREAMYGWMTLHLKGEGDGSPIREPEIETVEPEALRCFPGGSRPDDWLTLPQFAALEARRIIGNLPKPETSAEWSSWRSDTLAALKAELTPPVRRRKTRKPIRTKRSTTSAILAVESEPYIGIRALVDKGDLAKVVILIDVKGMEKVAPHKLATELRRANWSVHTIDLRATGATAHSGDKIGRAADHNTAEWSLWTGRTLLEQWVWDVRRILDETGVRKATLIGNGPAGVAALCAAAVDDRIERVATIDSLASYVSDVPYQNQRLGIMVPGVLRKVGDIPHIAALAAGKPLLVARGVDGAGNVLDEDELKRAYAFTSKAAASAGSVFAARSKTTAREIVKWLEEN